MIKIINENVLKTQEEFDMVIDSIVNSPKFRKYKDFILYVADTAEEIFEIEKRENTQMAQWPEYDEQLAKTYCFQALLNKRLFFNSVENICDAWDEMKQVFYDDYFDFHNAVNEMPRDRVLAILTRGFRDEGLPYILYCLEKITGHIIEENIVKNQSDENEFYLAFFEELKHQWKGEKMDASAREVVKFLIDYQKKLKGYFSLDEFYVLANNLYRALYQSIDDPFFNLIYKCLKLTKEETYRKDKIKYFSSEAMINLLKMISKSIESDETIQSDLFYLNNIDDDKDEDWDKISKLVKKMNNYTATYFSGFSKEESDLIKRCMTKKNYPLYRVESYSGNIDDYDKKIGDKISLTAAFGNDRTRGIASFSSNLRSNGMRLLIDERAGISGTDNVLIYKTVGDVYSLDIDAHSLYAQDIDHCEFEHFVSGEFEIVEIEKGNYGSAPVLFVTIKQLHK